MELRYHLRKLLLAAGALLLFALPSLGQVTVQPSPYIPEQFFDNNGKILSGGCLATFESGTSTPLATYSDAAGMSANANPTQLDSSGRAFIFLQSQAYTLKLYVHGTTNNCTTSLGPLIWSVDGINPGANSILSGNNVWTGSNTFNGPVTTNSTVTFNTGFTSSGPNTLNGGGSISGSWGGSPTFSGILFITGGMTFNVPWTSLVTTGTPPFSVNSTSMVTNLNASFLEGADWHSPPPIGDVAPNTVHSTAFHADTSIQLASGPVTTAMQGTDTSILTAGTFTGSTGTNICKDANGGATTVGCAGFAISTGALGTTSCTPAASSFATCNDVVAFSPTQADTNYVVNCTGESPSDPRAYLATVARTSTSSITVTTENLGSAAGVNFGDIRCSIIHR